MSTKRHYYDDAYLRQFSARVVASSERNGQPAIALDQSAFYPEGGGQPADHGLLQGQEVVDVQSDPDGLVWHVLGQPLQVAVGTLVHGEIDWARRFDHMQQHHGQHLLSAAFERLYELRTVSFHLGIQVVTIDLNARELTTAQIHAVEELTNQVIWENRPILARFVSAEELANIALRKPPSVSGPIRVVSVPDFDHSACGGTHPHSTGGVGVVHIRRWDRRGDSVRVEFACGARAMRDLRVKNALLMRLSGSLSVGTEELELAVSRIRESEDQVSKELAEARGQLLIREANALAEQAILVGDIRFVKLQSPARSLEELRTLAQLIASHGCVAILAMATDKGHLIIARGPGIPVDSNAILKSALAAFGGRGGGRPELAQGGIADASQVPALLEQAGRVLEQVRM